MRDIIKNNYGKHIQPFITAINRWADAEIRAKCKDYFSFLDPDALQETIKEISSLFQNHPIFNQEYNIPLPIQYLFLVYLIKKITKTFTTSPQEQELKPTWWGKELLTKFNLDPVLLNIDLSFFTNEPTETALIDFICAWAKCDKKTYSIDSEANLCFEIMHLIEALNIEVSYAKGLYSWLNQLNFNPGLAETFSNSDYHYDLMPILKGYNYFSLPNWNTLEMIGALKTDICRNHDVIVKEIMFLIQNQQPTIQPKQLLEQTKLMAAQINQHPFFNTEYSLSIWLQLSFAMHLLRSPNTRPIWWNQYVIVELLQLSPLFLKLPFSFFSTNPSKEAIEQFNCCFKDTLMLTNNWFKLPPAKKRETRSQLARIASDGNYFGKKLIITQNNSLFKQFIVYRQTQPSSEYIKLFNIKFLKSIYDIIWKNKLASGKSYEDYLEIENSFIATINQISSHPFITSQFPLSFQYFFLTYLENLLPLDAKIEDHYFYLMCCHAVLDEFKIPDLDVLLKSLAPLFEFKEEKYSHEIIEMVEIIEQFCIANQSETTDTFETTIGRIVKETKKKYDKDHNESSPTATTISVLSLPTTLLFTTSAKTQPITINQEEQLGWNCFDIAIGINRADLVNFALEHPEFRHLLAPEIRQAAVLTAVYLNNKEEEHAKKLHQNMVELSDLAEKFKHIPFIADKLNALAALQLTAGYQLKPTELLQNTLPRSMHTADLRNKINDYLKAYEAMRDTVSTCNDLIKQPSRLSFVELDEFFKLSTNQETFPDAYTIFIHNRENLFTKYEKSLDDYCQSIDIYRQYIQDYYGQQNWFCFQTQFEQDTKSTSMVDIAAIMLEATIIIYQNDKEIYRTDTCGSKVIEVTYNGRNHFIRKSIQENPQLTQQELSPVASTAAKPGFSTP